MSIKELFIRLPYVVFDSPEFATLSPIDVCVLLLLIRKHNGRNNGAIALGLQEVVIKCRCANRRRADPFTACNKLASLRYVAKVMP
jgi:hypothetical protein